MRKLKKYPRVVTIVLSAMLALLTFIGTLVYTGVFTTHRPPTESVFENNLPIELEEAVPQNDEFSANDEVATTPPDTPILFDYIEVTDGCGVHFDGECLRVREGPGTEYPVVGRLRNGMVLRIGETVEHNGEVWHKIIFDEWLRYPERVTSDWYVNGAYVQVVRDIGDETIETTSSSTAPATTKKIIVDRTAQKLYAYDGDTLFIEMPISTGLELTPTPRGTFTIFKKTPSRYMQGPLPNLVDQQSYDLPGVPWNLYFTEGGAVIHGAYWHDSFGTKYSHGCVNLSPENAHMLYTWAELGTRVIVRD
jgi:lipoprotein-anchoring transpeptidase ErfK/SrfK